VSVGSLIRIGLGLLAPLLGGTQIVAAIAASLRSAALLLLAGLAVMAAIGMACAALWQTVAPVWGPSAASLTVSGALLGLALGFWLVEAYWGRRARAVPEPPVADPIEPLTAALAELVGEKKAGALLTALLAGAAAGRAARRN
jgi:hypothetical protein